MATTLVVSKPDTAWTGRPRQEGLRPDTDPLIADTLYNAIYSPLCWLSDEVLLRIMKHLDPVGLQCLRRTSRLFLCRFSDEQFQKFHDHNGRESTDLVGPTIFFPWAKPRRLHGITYRPTPGATSLHQLIKKDTASSVCSACQRTREARYEWQRTLQIKRTGDSAWRHCKPCGMDHPPAHFLRLRQCIGRLGQVRLCAHRDCVVNWDTVVRYGKLLASQHASGGEEVACYYPSITLKGSKNTACLHYAGEENLPGEWQLARRQSNDGAWNQACRFPRDDNLDTMAPGTHTARTVLGGDLETRIDIDACAIPTQGPSQCCLKITVRRSILVAAPGQVCRGVTQSWYEALDPGSYRGTVLPGYEKTAFDGLACPRDDPACANYCRYLERPVAPRDQASVLSPGAAVAPDKISKK
ncbi:hypothetical protein B0T26DRAFT_669476 [Lasiosphaeria miniovina]|uniref:F-box domain-containing protein n=1 Tax=Lasiosphaeria miniovina TaxID=1954250 RepID=A0AA40BEY9_9PEZI|nr:uncharacterized protein B0T26DRAFT_669476 [Lasiosphaeria miniovina]KAK0733020.1 hypothetical protein B0T26DRAFT_669476 [Lasiosphaeria miniovina]